MGAYILNGLKIALGSYINGYGYLIASCDIELL